jgi:hypothetical protein
MQRTVVAVLAVVLLATAGGLFLFGEPGGNTAAWAGLCGKVGLILAVFWLALPDAKPLKNRLVLAGILGLAMVIVLRPRMLLILKQPQVLGLLGVALVAWRFLRPASSSRAKRPRDKRERPADEQERRR